MAIVEKDITAGTCTNYGCSAKFLLDSPFEFIDSLSRYDKAGITGNTKVNWQELMAYKNLKFQLTLLSWKVCLRKCRLIC